MVFKVTRKTPGIDNMTVVSAQNKFGYNFYAEILTQEEYGFNIVCILRKYTVCV